MNKDRTNQSAFVNVCILLGVLVFFAGIVAALFAATNSQSFAHNGSARARRSDGVPVVPAGEVYQAWVARYTPSYEADDDVKALAVDTQGNVYVTGQSWGLGGNYGEAFTDAETGANTQTASHSTAAPVT